ERRCLVLADGFYEWQRGARPKQPYYVRMADDRPFAFAGLWDQWRRGPRAIQSCAIITTSANELGQTLHDRMPGILDPKQYETWLDPGVHDPKRLKPLLAPYGASGMTTYPVRAVVNNVEHDVPECIEAARDKMQGTLFD